MRVRTISLLLAAVLPTVFASPACAERPTARCVERLKLLQAHPLHAREHPAMMAVGDSLYNGVTSLTIDRRNAEHSVPATVARALSLTSFAVPTYPQPILIDLEREILRSLLGIVSTAGDAMQRNIQWWLVTYPAAAAPTMPRYFDNIAVAQASSVQLMCDTAARADFWLSHNPVDPDSLGFPDALGTWYYELNSRFILNPRLENESVGPVRRDQLSQLAQVMVREPKRLLINIGSNDGVWLMAFDGYAPDTPYQNCLRTTSSGDNKRCTSTTVRHEMADLVQNMRDIAGFVPAATEFVYVSNLPMPSRAANLNPWPGAQTTWCNSSIDGTGAPTIYFTRYQTYLSDQKLAEVTADQACAMDKAVNQTNAAIDQAMRAVLGKRLVIVDLYQLLQTYDAKHLGPSHGIPVTLDIAGTADVVLTNTPVHPQTIFGNLASGGFFGYDNMHPSFVGYGMVAKTVLDLVHANEHRDYNSSVVDPQKIILEIEADPAASAIKTDAVADLNVLYARIALAALPATPSNAPPFRSRNPPFGAPHEPHGAANDRGGDTRAAIAP